MHRPEEKSADCQCICAHLTLYLAAVEGQAADALEDSVMARILHFYLKHRAHVIVKQNTSFLGMFFNIYFHLGCELFALTASGAGVQNGGIIIHGGERKDEF